MQSVKKTYNLFLDDIRDPRDPYRYTRKGIFLTEDWTVVRSYDEFVDYITVAWEKYSAFPCFIAFDHDLSYEHYNAPVTSKFKEKTGYDCAKWLVDFCTDKELVLPEFFCHSMNPVGRDNINYLLTNFKKHQEK